MHFDEEKLRFHDAIGRVVYGENRTAGIGTLGEKTLHAVCKLYMEPNIDFHEVPLGKYVADICREDRIVEVQTRDFRRLFAKLETFLKEGYRVTVVYPIPALKWLSWLDPETGSVTPKRKSPRRGTVYDIGKELYQIRPLLCHPNLDFRILLLEVQDFRSLNGWSADRKKGSSRFERIPLEWLGSVTVGAFDGYEALLPDGLPSRFTSADFAKSASIPRQSASRMLQILTCTETVRRIGKKGNGYLYCTWKQDEKDSVVEE